MNAADMLIDLHRRLEEQERLLAVYRGALEGAFEILDRVKPLAPEPGNGALFFTNKQIFDDRMHRAQDMVEAKAFIRISVNKIKYC